MGYKSIVYELDRMCKKFNCESELLDYFDERSKTDRECYNKILPEVQRIVPLIRNGEIKKFPIKLLIAIMYWKLYSQIFTSHAYVLLTWRFG